MKVVQGGKSISTEAHEAGGFVLELPNGRFSYGMQLGNVRMESLAEFEDYDEAKEKLRDCYNDLMIWFKTYQFLAEGEFHEKPYKRTKGPE